MSHAINTVVSFFYHRYSLPPLAVHVTPQVEFKSSGWASGNSWCSSGHRAPGLRALRPSQFQTLICLESRISCRLIKWQPPSLHPLIYGHPSHWPLSDGIYAWQHSQCHLRPMRTQHTRAHINTPLSGAPGNIGVLSQPAQKLFIKFVAWWYCFMETHLVLDCTLDFSIMRFISPCWWGFTLLRLDQGQRIAL